VDLGKALQLVMDEVLSATSKFPQFNSAHEGYAVLLEEVDELWQEVKHGKNPSDMTLEAIQVAAMGVRFLMDVCKEPTPSWID